MVYIVPELGEFGKLVGSFDESSLKDHERRLLSSSLPMQKYNSQNLDLVPGCVSANGAGGAAGPQDSLNDADEIVDDDFDEILAEILAEEAEARRARELSDPSQESGKKTKKKKKKKSSSKKSDL